MSKLGSGYWSLASLTRRKRALKRRIERLDGWISRARKLPRQKTLTPTERRRRYRRVLVLRERLGLSYREIAAEIKVSSARAQRIYLDACNQRASTNGH